MNTEQIVLAKRPEGIPSDEIFKYETVEVNLKLLHTTEYNIQQQNLGHFHRLALFNFSSPHKRLPGCPTLYVPAPG